MRGEDDRRARRRLVLVLDEDGATLLELADHMRVVDDLLAHVHGRPIQLERALDGLDGAFDARAVAARRGTLNAPDHPEMIALASPAAPARLGGAEPRGRSSPLAALRTTGRVS